MNLPTQLSLDFGEPDIEASCPIPPELQAQVIEVMAMLLQELATRHPSAGRSDE